MPITPNGTRIDLSPEALAALPSLEELEVPLEMVEAAEDLFSTADAPGVERSRIEVFLRLFVSHQRALAR